MESKWMSLIREKGEMRKDDFSEGIEKRYMKREASLMKRWTFFYGKEELRRFLIRESIN